MAKVSAYVVTRNETENYLEPMLSDLIPKVDGVAVYDDQSTDGTAEVARNLGCAVCVRPTTVPTFDQHEGRFRQAAWDWAATALGLSPGDWLLAIDADEWFMSREGDAGFRDRLRIFCNSIPSHYTAVLLQKHEVFAIENGVPMVRTDGYWGRIIGTRLARWQPGGVFSDKKMGSGCEPTYAPRMPYNQSGGFYLIHYGYATPEAQRAKYERYTSFLNHGHNDSHIQSIIGPARLEPFSLPYPRTVRAQETVRLSPQDLIPAPGSACPEDVDLASP